MEDSLQQPSDVSELMPCPLDWSMSKKESFWNPNTWTFWSSRPNDELNYQRKKMAAPVVPTYTGIGKDTTKSIFERISDYGIWLVQFWSPVKVNGLTFLSTADQPFALTNRLDKRMCTYRKHCVDTLIPVDIDYANGEALLGPPGRAFIRGFPEYTLDIRSYSAVEFPLLQHAIQSGIKGYCASPVFKLHDKHCLGVFEIASTYECLSYPNIKWQVPLDQIEEGLDVVCEAHSLPFAQIWIPDSRSNSIKAVIGRRSYGTSSSMYFNFVNASGFCFIQRGKAVVGRAFSSQGSCFCKDVTLLSLTEYPLVPSAREAGLTRCFAICLRNKCINDFICVVEYFLPPNEMVDRDAETFLNMLLSAMKEQLPGVVVASGKELGQRMLVEVIKVSPFDELDFFEIGQPLPSVQSLQDGGEATEIDSLYKQSNLQSGEHNVTTALIVPSCSSRKLDSFNCEGPVQVDILHPHPTEAALANRGRVDVDVAPDNIESEKDASDMMQLDSHFELQNVEIVSTGNGRNNDKVDDSDIARCRTQLVEAEAINEESYFISGVMTNIQKINCPKNNKIQDHGITCEKPEEQFGKIVIDAADNLSVSQSTVKRICRECDISRWPHHIKNRKVNHHVSEGVSLQGVEPYIRDQPCPDLSQEKGTDYLAHKSSPATGKVCDSMMTLKVTYRDDIIKFKLTPSATKVELQGEVEKRLKFSLEKFSIKYQDEDDDWVTITGDSDLRDGMDELRSLERTTMRLMVTPNPET